MKQDIDYLEINKESWNKRTDVHIDSDFYDMKGFMQGHTSLKEIELGLLGDIKGKSILHLQCHFGQDSLSLQRMGAQVTGVDLSDKSIDKARQVAKELNLDTEFICCDLYDAVNHIDKKFDMVFTTYGTVGWLPDMDKWAHVVSHFLKPNGTFIFADFHPVVWMMDDDFETVSYNYFNSGPLIEKLSGTYTNPEAELNQVYVDWNHGIGEVVNSLIKNGLQIQLLDEFDYSPYNCFRHTVEFEPGKYRIKHMDNKLPMVWAIKAQKKT